MSLVRQLTTLTRMARRPRLVVPLKNASLVAFTAARPRSRGTSGHSCASVARLSARSAPASRWRSAWLARANSPKPKPRKRPVGGRAVARVAAEVRTLRAELPAEVPVLAGGAGAPALAAALAEPGIAVAAGWADLRGKLGVAPDGSDA